MEGNNSIPELSLAAEENGLIVGHFLLSKAEDLNTQPIKGINSIFEKKVTKWKTPWIPFFLFNGTMCSKRIGLI